MPNEQELKAYYDREQWFEGGEPGGYQDYEKQTRWSVDALKRILDQDFAGKTGLSILDVGCGYGAHLDAAAALGWKCFGTEISAHARGIAQKRLGGRAYITEEVGELIPHEFDVVLILDVIEHLANPYALFYSLFSIGAITPKTRVIITTPNAGSHEASVDPAGWTYRHPPSHLLYYRAKTFEFLLSKLGFNSIRVRGEHLQPSRATGEQTLADYAGLHVEAEGSNFTEFMRERYVPGTWSKIAEYEHLPRYALAKRFVQDKAVLDFGCGTGYGSAVLAGAGGRVLGLDIDAEAIAWARSTHTGSGAQFHCCDDLGATLPSASFDVVTCFEMIEHVDLQTQHRAIEQIARLLRDDGVFVISTPNPEITGMYGANPYHLREMTREEFAELLGPHFQHLHIVEQRVRNSVSFESTQTQAPSSFEVLQEQASKRLIPLAYIAFCSKQPLPNVAAAVMFDDAVDVVHEFLDQEKKKNALRFSAYGLAEQVERLDSSVRARDQALQEAQLRQEQLTASAKLRYEHYEQALAEATSRHEQVKAELQSTAATLQTLKLTRWFRLRELLLVHPFGLRKVILVAATIGGGLLPRRWHSRLVPPMQRLFGLTPAAPPAKKTDAPRAYRVKVPGTPAADAPRVVHAIANFMTGGSSRLVVDLVEHLGANYRQTVLTSFNPDPPAYEALEIEECRSSTDIAPLVEYFKRTQPDFVHVHYWGDCDEPWYAKVIEAARQLGLPVIENINTPIEPHRSDAVERYVYVSDYVRSVFGDSDARHVTVYPGSDFSLFTRASDEHAPDDCVGMVYRLERDKLNEGAILPFIEIAKLRPQTRVLIVGGGSLLEPFQAAVKAAGVADRFEFTGYVPYDALPDLYRRMSVFVAPIWKESFGQVAPFAMSMKVPVVGYDVGAIGEIIGNPALLAPAADQAALAKIVVDLLDAPELRRDIGSAQQRRAEERFSVQAMIAHYTQIYAELTASAQQERS
ncbi:methyltransferase domain-containing protein [Variovorax sp. N23]|uniref:methyltransferase domain-containing protein n=1 Tax=Variovorax sp. N23 TaxID=2980555 RepID=UPI0021C96B24|nr:methyltransferase domain-containing protein [Variovorax sp. N23]MCU4121268.1 methyltransferase domain-containing protein [Variovorax sp. N23]